MSSEMYNVTYINLSGKTEETKISKVNQVEELRQLREKGYIIRDITNNTEMKK